MLKINTGSTGTLTVLNTTFSVVFEFCITTDLNLKLCCSSGILSPTDEFQYWADMASTGKDRARARYFSDAFHKQIAPQFASMSSLTLATAMDLIEDTQDTLDDVWQQTDVDPPFPEPRMRRLMEVIGTVDFIHLYLSLLRLF